MFEKVFWEAILAIAMIAGGIVALALTSQLYQIYGSAGFMAGTALSLALLAVVMTVIGWFHP